MAEYIKHTGGSVSGKSKKPYDAMVYKDADSGYTIAVDGNGNVIKKVLSSLNTDNVVIQAALDTNSVVFLTAGVYNISSTLSIKSYTSLYGCDRVSTVLKVMSNITCVLMSNTIRSSARSVSIELHLAQTEPAILLSPSSITMNGNIIEDMYIYSNVSGSPALYSAIKLKNYTTNKGIWSTLVRDVSIYNCSTGIDFDINGTNAWINLNEFDNITINQFVIGIHVRSSNISSSNYGSNTNVFNYIAGQCSSTYTTYGVKIENDSVNTSIGSGKNFEFNNAHFIDMPASGKYYSFESGVSQCIINGGTMAHTWSLVSDNGYGTSIIERTRTNLKKLYNGKLIVVSGDGAGDYKSVSSAINSISDNSDSVRYTILVIGKVVDTAKINWKSYVDLRGINNGELIIDTSTNGAGIYLSGLTNVLFEDIKVVRSGNVSSPSDAISIDRCYYDTVILHNVDVSNQIINATASCHGITVHISSPVLTNVRAEGSPIGNTSHGFNLYGASSPLLIGCTGIHGRGSGGYGFCLDLNTAATLIGCSALVKTSGGTFIYSGDSYEIVPFSDYPYFIVSASVYVSVAGGGGSTLKLGTTDGGGEIATVSLSSTGNKYFVVNNVPVLANSPIYAKPSDTSARFSVYYIVGYNSTSGGFYVNSQGRCRISNCKFYSNQASPAGYITTTSRTAGKFRIENCSFESVGTYDLEGQTAGVVPVYNCTFGRGSLINITLPGQGTAATITAGNTYVDVTHSLASTPTKVRVTPTTNLGTRSFWVDTKGASTFRININSSDVINHTFDWEAEV